MGKQQTSSRKVEEHGTLDELSYLTGDERVLYRLATTWQDDNITGVQDSLDWARVVALARSNRMQVLLHGALARLDLLDRLPDPARQALQADVDRMRGDAAMMGAYLAWYLRKAAARGLETVVLKGLALSIDVYGNAAMRPGGDIDILVREKDVPASVEILQEMGVGPYWDNLLHDSYYVRHHLHLQRCTPDLRVWFEVHWALDHPLTHLTVDYEGMMDRTRPGSLLGEPVNKLSLPDLILSLALHLVKHAVYLPSALKREDLARLIIADGMLMYFVDVAEVIKQRGDRIDWTLMVDLARQWGAADTLGSVLQVCARLLDTPIPPDVLDTLPVTGVDRLTAWTMTRVADYEVTTHLGEEPSRLWEFLLVTNGAFILRPIRFLDLATYFFPGRDFLERRYGSASLATGLGHIARASAQYARVAVDTVYFTLERYSRMKRRGLNASFFNRLDSKL